MPAASVRSPPTVSNTASTPMPSVTDATASSASGPGLTARAAPSFSASFSRSSSRSTMTTCDVGEDGAEHEEMQQPHAARRRAPLPSRRPRCPERSMPRSTQAAGSTKTAFSSESVSGTLRAASAVARCLDQDRVGEAAGLHQVFLENLAHRLVAAPAEHAFAARDVMRHHDPVALGEFRRPRRRARSPCRPARARARCRAWRFRSSA